ncbi:hypothetical protein B0T18DRAFT_387524 [Schizothecium vesticola]|uniref:Uncharacterized protein n=1 Tax=Schizothecium vesticola TaxID=314040 RepID=A0AA40F5F7_9PEZI|nr:hypothetical protein B0T18DRAFT_387524 [Schizothecium vesticola]
MSRWSTLSMPKGKEALGPPYQLRLLVMKVLMEVGGQRKRSNSTPAPLVVLTIFTATSSLSSVRARSITPSVPPPTGILWDIPSVLSQISSWGTMYHPIGAAVDTPLLTTARPRRLSREHFTIEPVHDTVCRTFDAKETTAFDCMLRERAPSFPKRAEGEDRIIDNQPSLSAHIDRCSVGVCVPPADGTYFDDRKEEIQRRKDLVFKCASLPFSPRAATFRWR